MAFAITTLHRRGWLRSVKAWVAISDFMRERLVEAGVESERVFTVRHPWGKAAAETATVSDEGYYLFLARLHKTKGVAVALEAWRKIYQQAGAAGPALWMAGTGPMVEEVKAAAAQNPLIKVCGLLTGEAKQAALQNCRALLAPAVWWEPLGLSTYEAYAAAKPVLAARSGGLTETVVAGETGWLHSPGNAAELAAQVLSLEKEPARAVAMGRAGREWLAANTRISDWSARMVKVFQFAITGGKL
jgi:glycosyltransferase involved in cell wall biosynthesis